MKRAATLLLPLCIVTAALSLRPRPLPPARPASILPAPELRTESVAPEPEPAPAAESIPAPPPVAPDPAPVTLGAVDIGLRRLLRLQNADGSWGSGSTLLDGRVLDPAGMTSLALLALLGAGYTHLSREDWGDVDPGAAVKRALQYLLALQGGDGRLSAGGDPALNQALGTLALNEAWGMTASRLFEGAARASVDALQRLQSADGSWGEPRPSLWGAMALLSARIGDIAPDPAALERAREWHRARRDGDASSLAADALLGRKLEDPARDRAAAALAGNPPVQDPAAWYYGSLALYTLDGPSGERWKAWSAALKADLLASGAWPGRTDNETLVRTALGTLALEVVYRYR